MSPITRVINFNFLFQSLTRDISYSMENLAIDSLLKRKLIEQSFLTTSLNQFLLEWLGEFVSVSVLVVQGIQEMDFKIFKRQLLISTTVISLSTRIQSRGSTCQN